ncbi:MAG: type I methionyl aminopeptidase [Candidatus Pacebacteria bacterium]|nr:type I methionyl aminopeptidase [Candidatus Paceibacterota bacterium]MDD5013282.1 type I methionyl aminopeptidase [Candidatus Paceibacterota bacterium]MDD5752883.1 type I methionyl aminopeptidase [Candidatus Paceibacterota bacterium]
MIAIKTKEEIQVMKQGGMILANVMDELEREVKIGVSGDYLEKKAQELITKAGGKCNFKGQDGFPSCLCFSINQEIVHGLPNKIAKDGDILSLDLGIFFPLSKFISGKIDEKKYPNLKNGLHTDMARTFLIGEVDLEIQRLVRVTKKALKRGIKKVRPGVTFGDIGETIERYVVKQGFDVVRELCGHGIGKDLHEEPDVLNFGERHSGSVLKEGMVFCIEPMVSIGDTRIKKGKDGYSYITKDNSFCAHFEHMIAVTKDGSVILTE